MADEQTRDGNLVADRDLFLSKDGKTLVEEGAPGAASQLVVKGHAITRDEAQRLNLSIRDGKVVQDSVTSIESMRAKLAEVEGDRDALAQKIEQYRKDNAVKDIPNTMEAQRVAIEARIDRIRLELSTAIKDAAGKDPFLGESQATAIRPDLDTATPGNPAEKPSDHSSRATESNAPTTAPTGNPAESTTRTPQGRGE